MNTVLDGYPSLDSEHFVYGQSRRILTILRGLLLLLGCGLAYLVAQTPINYSAKPLLFWTISVLAIVLVVRPMRGSISFTCDPQGVYFPSRKALKIFASTMPQKWLLVPWTNISAINVQLLPDESGIKKVVMFCLRATDAERQIFFTEASTLKVDTKLPIGNQSSFLAGYSNAFKSPYKTVAILSRFRRLKTEVLAESKPKGNRP